MRTGWLIATIIAVVTATIAALALVGTGSPPREPTVHAERAIDAAAGDPLLARLAHTLPPPPTDGIRFVAHPTFADRDYAFQIATPVPGGPAKAILIVAPRDGSRKRRHRFNVRGADARAFFATVDGALPGIGKPDVSGTDGTQAALERISGGESRTWTSNMPDREWTPVNTAILALLRTHAPDPDLPAADDWQNRTR